MRVHLAYNAPPARNTTRTAERARLADLRRVLHRCLCLPRSVAFFAHCSEWCGRRPVQRRTLGLPRSQALGDILSAIGKAEAKPQVLAGGMPWWWLGLFATGHSAARWNA